MNLPLSFLALDKHQVVQDNYGKRREAADCKKVAGSDPRALPRYGHDGVVYQLCQDGPMLEDPFARFDDPTSTDEPDKCVLKQ